MKDFENATQDDLLETESGRYYINGSDHICCRTPMAWSDIFHAIDRAEDDWREWLLKGLLAPFKDHVADPLSGLSRSGDDSSETPTFLLFSEYGAQKKFRYIKRVSVFFEWMCRNGHVPGLDARDLNRTRFPRGFDVQEALNALSATETKQMLSSILIEKDTRISMASGSIENSLEYDFDHIRDLARRKVNDGDPLSFLNQLMNDGLSTPSNNHTNRLRKQSKFRFLAHLACNQAILLPARKLAENAKTITLYSGFMRSYAYRQLANERLPEIIVATNYLKSAHNGNRQLRIVDFLVLFCAGNYGTSKDFAPEYLVLAQTATAGTKNNYRPYFQAIKDFANVNANEFREWDAKLRGRNSLSMSGGNFALFQESAIQVKAALPVQVSNYEKKTGQKFPSSFDQGIIDWTYLLEKYINKLPRTNLEQVFSSATLWLTYLTTLRICERPGNFGQVERSLHIKSDDDTTNTYVAFIKANGLGERERLRDLHQLMEIWRSEQKIRVHLPIDPKIDWKNRQKSFGTKRKAIPTIIVETLIEENARECSSGIPYALYRNWIEERGTAGSIYTLEGVRADAKIPSVPAVIDCILHLGMRSSSARWLDSGQADEFLVDPETLEEAPNSSPDAISGVRNGFIQRMQVGPSQWVNSFLIVRNKTGGKHEIPYAPDKLIQRLLYISKLQQFHNELGKPIRAVEKEKTTNHLDEVPLVFPLFRDPSNSDSKPVSYAKITRWWVELLKKCEPNEKRKVHYGENCDYYDFFDSSGKSLWDIHSIRVTVVTALLDMGVSPTIVQHLVGHKNFVMTLHYHAVETGQINTAIAEALETRRVAAADAIANARDEEELDDAMETLMGGFASSISGGGIRDATGYAFANGKTLKNSPSAFSVFSHGICPGGDCAQGGAKHGNVHLAVHRDKACSRCRFRITGPAFLAGLEMNANILMNEIAESTRKEERLNAELLELNRLGKPAAVIESRLEQERIYRDEIWADWAAEYQTVKECLELAKSEGNNENLPSLPTDASILFHEKGQLRLLQDIVGKSKMIAGGAFDIPEGLEEIRNEMLWDIAIESGDVARYLISLNKEERSNALHHFGSIVCKHFDEFGEDSEALFSYEERLQHIKQLSASRTDKGGR